MDTRMKILKYMDIVDLHLHQKIKYRTHSSKIFDYHNSIPIYLEDVVSFSCLLLPFFKSLKLWYTCCRCTKFLKIKFSGLSCFNLVKERYTLDPVYMYIDKYTYIHKLRNKHSNMHAYSMYVRMYDMYV